MRGTLAATSLTLILTTACAADEPKGGATTTQSIDLWGRYVRIACKKARTCCAQARLDAQGLETCEQDMSRALKLDQLIGSIDDGSVRFDAPLFTRCLDMTEQQVDQCGELEVLPECQNALRGALPAGEKCESAMQCAAPHGAAVCLRVVPNDASEAEEEAIRGVCHSDVHGKLGDACSDSCERAPCRTTHTTEREDTPTAYCFLEDGLYCDYVSSRCETLRKLGENCRFSEACVPGTFCADSGTCQVTLSEGQSCEDHDACAEGLMCGAAETCTPRGFVDEDFCAGDLD
jgi:hypothetical protein